VLCKWLNAICGKWREQIEIGGRRTSAKRYGQHECVRPRRAQNQYGAGVPSSPYPSLASAHERGLRYSREPLVRSTYADELGSVRRGRVAGSTGACTHHVHHPCILPLAPWSHAATRHAPGDIFARVRAPFTSTAAAAMRALIVARACTPFTQKVRPPRSRGRRRRAMPKVPESRAQREAGGTVCVIPSCTTTPRASLRLQSRAARVQSKDRARAKGWERAEGDVRDG
jgi:hypothetical protein